MHCYVTKNAFQVGTSSGGKANQSQTIIGLHGTVPVWSLNKHLPRNSLLSTAQLNLLVENKEFCRAEQSLLGDLPILDVQVRFPHGPGQELNDLLTLLTTRLHFLLADGRVAFEGEMSLDLFSVDEISHGGGKMILMPLRCTAAGVDSRNICQIDMVVSIKKSTTAETGAVGLDPHVEAEAGATYRNEHEFPMAITELNCVKTETEDERIPSIAGNCSVPLDLSLPKDLKPDTTAGLSLASNDVAVQT